MSGTDLLSIQDDIEAYVKSNINWLVETGGVEDAKRIAGVNGVQDPYVVLRFSDDMPTARGGTFYGARYDEYYSYVDALCCADNDRTARQISGLVKNLLLGHEFDNAGQMTKNFGGGIFSQPAANSIPTFYISVASFRFSTNMIADGTGYDGS